MPPKRSSQKPPRGGQSKVTPRGKGRGDEDEPAPQTTQIDLEVPKVYIKPDDQLQLTEEQLSEEMTMILTANNPNAPKNIARYSYKERAYKFDPSVDQVAEHFAMDGYMIHKESEEAKKQLMAAENAAGEGGAEDGTGEDTGDEPKALRNQFNYSERATQTYHNQRKERQTMTEPPPSTNFSATASQWEMFDAYVEDIDRNRSAKEKANKASRQKSEEISSKPQSVKSANEDVIYSGSMEKSLHVVERMVNQNTYDEIGQDFKYYEDASDAFKEDGTLLPLWKFVNDKYKRKHVTAICWNPEFPDLFAVGYGSYDFMKQGTGAIACFSLKNASNAPDPSHPEYSFTTDVGVTCLDFHPQHSSLLAVGLYDGNVCVFDVRNKVNRPIFQSTAKTGKHTDPVWQVYWQEEDLAKNLNFFSISSDGRVTLWTLSKNELQFTDVLHLKLTSTDKDADAEDDAALSGLAGGCCFDFNQFSEHLFIVGTEEGTIHKCSKAYNSQYLQTYEGHYMNVYSVRWNPFHSRLFLSASADWTVKLWDHMEKSPIMSFDLNNSVGDVAWAPGSSTVFAAVTADGKVHVFDLKESKHEPLCEQQVVKGRTKLTHLCWNPVEPILLVGDDRGSVTSLKLSPNLRKAHTTQLVAPQGGRGGGPGARGGTASSGPGGNANANQPATNADGTVKSKADLERELIETVLSLNEKGDAH
eukprot:TRINITY_DN5620_c0_g1_i2.p1 TRINITY_DN5620_c0_g1~~TRINITY_DN5620_c0_g1_i2.p1  ORF type:complete len:700 (-),score=180.55 TRINITY_DN5620_c0_g1_i2:218-2317(-)